MHRLIVFFIEAGRIYQKDKSKNQNADNVVLQGSSPVGPDKYIS